jgi:hypothetical protein
MKEHRLKRPTLVMELSLALAASLVAGHVRLVCGTDLALLLRLKWACIASSVRL